MKKKSVDELIAELPKKQRYGIDDLVDLVLRSLDLHGHSSIKVIPYPTGSTGNLCCMPCPVSESDTLNLSIKCDSFAGYICGLHMILSLQPWLL